MESTTYTVFGRKFELRHGRGCNQYQHRCQGAAAGVRRYQNKDGTLTEAGQRRYERDIRENNAKKKDNRIVIDKPDPDRWVREDINRAKKVVDATSDLNRELKKADSSKSSRKKKNIDLSAMTDQELRDQINRMNLERQYIDMVSPKQVSRGREFISSFLETAGTTLAIAGSALYIAQTIKELRG